MHKVVGSIPIAPTKKSDAKASDFFIRARLYIVYVKERKILSEKALFSSYFFAKAIAKYTKMVYNMLGIKKHSLLKG